MSPQKAVAPSRARTSARSKSSGGAAWRSRFAPLQQRWLALSARERSLARLAAAAVAILLIWLVGLAPALSTLRQVDLKRGPLDARQQRMLVLKAEADRLKALPVRSGGDDRARALATSAQARLGITAQIAVAGDRATLTLRGTPAAALAAWLADARVNARALPTEAKLVRSAPRAPVVLPTALRNIAALASASASGQRPPAFNIVAGGIPTPAANAPVASAAAPVAVDEARWDGTLVMALPPR